MDVITELKAIIATLQTLDIKATRNNMDALLGSMQHLDMILEFLQKEDKEKQGNIMKIGDK